jgi:hypothetical protein
VRVSVALATVDVVTELGEKLAVTPCDKPAIESATVPLNPFHADTFTAMLIECPKDKVDEPLGVAVMVKLGEFAELAVLVPGKGTVKRVLESGIVK